MEQIAHLQPHGRNDGFNVAARLTFQHDALFAVPHAQAGVFIIVRGARFHDLRHTHATILLANNIDAVAVATRMGHADASVTLRIYAHALRRRDEDAAQAAQGLLDRAQLGEELGDKKE